MTKLAKDKTTEVTLFDLFQMIDALQEAERPLVAYRDSGHEPEKHMLEDAYHQRGNAIAKVRMKLQEIAGVRNG